MAGKKLKFHPITSAKESNSVSHNHDLDTIKRYKNSPLSQGNFLHTLKTQSYITGDNKTKARDCGHGSSSRGDAGKATAGSLQAEGHPDKYKI